MHTRKKSRFWALKTEKDDLELDMIGLRFPWRIQILHKK